MLTSQLGQQGFIWFVGLVIDNADPLQIGRVKVREHIEHDGLSDADLPWAIVSTPTTSASINNHGQTPRLAAGSNVIGFYLDGREKQHPVIIGSFHTKPDQSTIPALARGQGPSEPRQAGQPSDSYGAEYPYNYVHHTGSGHTIEYDDTPGNERIKIRHRTGSFIEINKDGRVIHKNVNDSYDLTIKDKTISLRDGDLSISTKAGKMTIESAKDITIKAPGGITLSEGSLSVNGAISSFTSATGSFTSPTGQVITVQNGIVTSIT